MFDHHDKHTGHATKGEQINSFIGERFIGIIEGALTSGDRCPDASEGAITLVFECGWGIVFQGTTPDRLWVENPEHLKRTAAVIVDYYNGKRDVIYPAWFALNPPPLPTNDKDTAAMAKAKAKRGKHENRKRN